MERQIDSFPAWDEENEMPPILKWTWNHDACVENPVSGAVWGDVLRQVAVWSYRVDVHAARLERVCKKWKFYWQVAEGIFDIDMRAMRIPQSAPNPFRLHRERDEKRSAFLARQFTIRPTNAPPPLLAAPMSYGGALEEHRWKRAFVAAEQHRQTLDRIAKQCENLRPDPPTMQLQDFVASWPSGRLGGA